MNRFRIRLLVLAALTAGLTTWGCASPPEAEKKAAEEALANARAAGAEKYAASELAAAAQQLSEAEAQMVAKKYAAAQRSYLGAKEAGLKAAKAANAGKTAMTPQVEQQLAEVVKRWEDVAGRIKAAKKLTVDQKRDWEADAQRITATLQEARALLDNDPASAREKLAAATLVLEAWATKVTGPAASANNGTGLRKR